MKLAIEIDGDSHFHSGAIEYDKQREEEIKMLGIQFLRFQNNEVYKNLNGILQSIYERTELIHKDFRPPVVPLVKGDKNIGTTD